MEIEDNSHDLSNFATKGLILLEASIEVSPVWLGIIAKEHLEDLVEGACQGEQVLLEICVYLVYGGAVVKAPLAQVEEQLVQVACLVESVSK